MKLSLAGIIILLLVGILVLFIIFFIIIKKTRKAPGKDDKGVRSKDKNTIVKDANRRLSQNPKDTGALQALADVYYDEGNWEKAMKTYSMLLDLCATNPEIDEDRATLRYGIAAMRMKKYDEAYKALMISKTKNPDSFEINSNLGQIEYRKKQYEKAVALLQKAVGQNQEHIPSQKLLGQSLFKVKKYKEALTYLKRVIDLEPSDKESVFYLAQAYYELGMNDQAIKIFTHLRADPMFGPHAALYSGTLNLKTRKYEQAQLDFEIGLKHETIKPEIALELKYRLATAYIQDSNIGKALPLLTEIQSINPSYKDVASQINKYKELNNNRNLQIYLMSSPSEFANLCRKMVNNFFPKSKVKITDISLNKSESADVLAEIETTQWVDTVLFRMIRSNGQIGELLVRDFHSRIKDTKAGRGFCISAGAFSEGAQQFVEARFIDLLGKEELMAKLAKI